MLQNRDITYFLYCYDHLLPRKKYPALEEAIWNRVLACRPCNGLKLDFDPSFGGIPGTRDYRGSIPATKEYRDKLIERAKAYIQEQKRSKEASFVQEREIITATLREFEGGKAVSV
jgi:hypothetical protein